MLQIKKIEDRGIAAYTDADTPNFTELYWTALNCTLLHCIMHYIEHSMETSLDGADTSAHGMAWEEEEEEGAFLLFCSNSVIKSKLNN